MMIETIPQKNYVYVLYSPFNTISPQKSKKPQTSNCSSWSFTNNINTMI